jgi:hypothetical protein
MLVGKLVALWGEHLVEQKEYLMVVYSVAQSVELKVFLLVVYLVVKMDE